MKQREIEEVIRFTLEIVNRDISPPTTWKIRDRPATLSEIAKELAREYTATR